MACIAAIYIKIKVSSLIFSPKLDKNIELKINTVTKKVIF